MTQRTSNENTCDAACQLHIANICNCNCNHCTSLTAASALRDSETKLIHHTIRALQIRERALCLGDVAEWLGQILSIHRLIIRATVVADVSRVYLGR